MGINLCYEGDSLKSLKDIFDDNQIDYKENNTIASCEGHILLTVIDMNIYKASANERISEFYKLRTDNLTQTLGYFMHSFFISNNEKFFDYTLTDYGELSTIRRLENFFQSPVIKKIIIPEQEKIIKAKSLDKRNSIRLKVKMALLKLGGV